jgi:hypothetical protein
VRHSIVSQLIVVPMTGRDERRRESHLAHLLTHLINARTMRAIVCIRGEWENLRYKSVKALHRIAISAYTLFVRDSD